MRILFVHSSVKELLEAFNEDTVGIEYDESTSSSLLMEYLKSYPTADRLGFAFHYGESPFMNQESLFSDSDLLPNAQYSRNVQFIIDLIRNYEVVHVDFLACNTLLDERWKQFYTILHLETGVVVGASDDNTGNLKYGGDWIMESTQEDISQIYFNDTIVNFAKVLTTETLSGTSVASRQYYFDTTITSVVIASTITSIGSQAFTGCINLINVVFLIPNNVTSIGFSAFEGCTKLNSITLPPKLMLLQNSTFKMCSSLTSVVIATTITNIESQVFSGCTNLINVVFSIPNNVTSIGINAFNGCTKLNSITLPPKLMLLQNSTFSMCSSLTSMVIPDGVTEIGYGAFDSCSSFRYVDIPTSVVAIGQNAFKYTILETIIFPKNVQISDDTPGTNNNGVLAIHNWKIKMFRIETNNSISLHTWNWPSYRSNFYTKDHFINDTYYTPLRHELLVSKTNVYQGESFTVNFTINAELINIGRTQLTYTIAGVTSEDLSNASLTETVNTATTRTFTVAENVAKTITITLSDGTFQTVAIKFKRPRILGIGMKTRLQQFF